MPISQTIRRHGTYSTSAEYMHATVIPLMPGSQILLILAWSPWHVQSCHTRLEMGTEGAIPFLGLHKSKFLCSAAYCDVLEPQSLSNLGVYDTDQNLVKFLIQA
jgi:hypothetical protein